MSSLKQELTHNDDGWENDAENQRNQINNERAARAHTNADKLEPACAHEKMREGIVLAGIGIGLDWIPDAIDSPNG